MTGKSSEGIEHNGEQRAFSMETTGRRLVYFAAERTLLTWIRIALTLMGFGFIIDRFSIVFNQTFVHSEHLLCGKSITSWAGSGMVIMGTLVGIVAAASYYRFAVRYREGDTTPGNGLIFGVVLSLVVALIGIAIVILLFSLSV